MSANDLEIECLSFGYKNAAKVLDNVNFKIKGPQMISIIGPNGVGKSTLLYCLNKLLTPTEGTVYIEGDKINDVSIKDLAKRMSFVPHATRDIFPMSVMDTVLMGRHPHSGQKITNEDVKAAYAILKLLGIQEFALRPFDELSAGQHQRVVLARGLVQNTKMLLLDEPTSNLDIKHQMDVTRILKEQSVKNNMIVIMISHDLNIAARYSDVIIMLHNKGIYCVGSPKEVITEENIREVYSVESRIIEDSGRPYVILMDPQYQPGEYPENSSYSR